MQRPLREVLDDLTTSYLKPKPPTPRQKAAKQTETLAAIEDLLGKFNYRSLGMSFYSEEAGEAQAALTALAAKLRQQLTKLTAAGPHSSHNASKALRNEYWNELLLLLRQLTSKRLRRKHLIRFFRSCSPEQFMASDKAIITYLDRRKRAN